MRALGVMLVLAVFFISLPSWATKTYPNDMDSFSEQFKKSTMNFNKPTGFNNKQTSGNTDSTYPQGKNNFIPMPQKSPATTIKPLKPICIGSDCGCGSR